MRTIKAVIEKADDQVVIVNWTDLNEKLKLQTTTYTYNVKTKKGRDELLGAITRCFLEPDKIEPDNDKG